MQCGSNAELPSTGEAVLDWAISRGADLVVMSLRGEVDLSNADRLGRTIGDLVALRPPRIVIDLAQVSFLDSSGVSCLLAAAKAAEAAGCALRVQDPTESTLRVFQICGVDDKLLGPGNEGDAAARR
jgi:anti-sigma B factor antagonist